MTADELKNYRKLTYTIRYWRRELEQLRRESYTKSPGLTGMPGSGERPDPTSDLAMKEAKLLDRIERLVAEQQKESERILRWIEEIEDPLVQTIMHARYIRGKSWTAVSMAVGGYNSPDSVRMIHNRYLFGLFGK